MRQAIPEPRDADSAAHARHEYAETLVSWGEPRAARAQLERAVAARPGDPGAWHDLGLVRHATGDDAGAIEALARAEQLAAVGQMAASVAHQVGTPLNLISGYVQMLQEDASGDPRTARRLEIVQEQIAKVASVVRTLLDHSRRPGNRAPTAVGPVLSRVADVARPKLDASGITLKLDVAPDLPLIWADSEELELALLNLVTNSLDAMPAGGSLTIRATKPSHGVRVEVSDTGTGISKELLPRIFQPWVTTKAAGRGTGLGLSFTHDVIARHGGSIDAVSEPGRRTTFTIELPASDVAEIIDVHNSDR